MEEYKPNSFRYKEEQKLNEREKKVDKVVTGKVITKKKSGLSKLTNEFISEDAHSVGSYIVKDVIIPAAKKLIYDIFTDGIDILLYGESRKGGKRSTADRVSYTSYSSGRPPVRSDRASMNTGYSYDDIILATRGEAEDVLSRMDELISTYGLVRVADLYDLVGITGSYTDNKYGWTNIMSARIERVREGYMIRMPRAVPID